MPKSRERQHYLEIGSSKFSSQIQLNEEFTKTKIKRKERILKAAEIENTITFKGVSIWLFSRSLSRNPADHETVE